MMKNKLYSPDKPTLFEVDLKRTVRPVYGGGGFYWEGDYLIRIGQRRFSWTKALSQLSPSLKASFKKHLISFSNQGDYSPNSCTTFFESIVAALKAVPTSTVDVNWISQALRRSSFHRNKRGIMQFFLHWQERDNAAISSEALRLLHDTSALRTGPRNVLSDDPEKSWLTDSEYESLLHAVWDNYESGISGTQITLIKLLSMQYSRRPRQIALLKVGDIRESYGLDSQSLIGRFIDFPGIKDITAETDFRDSTFESHPLADHLWNLCLLQRLEVKTLYEYTLGFSLNDDQLNKLSLFCSAARIKEALQIIEGQCQLSTIESLDKEIFHLRKFIIIDILRWKTNNPSCSIGPHQRPILPKPPTSIRTGQKIVVTATRMRHTRARQLARQGIPKHMLSHWLGHSSEKTLDAYYNDPAEQARQLDEAITPALIPIVMAFTGTLIDSESQATRASDPSSRLEIASAGALKNVGHCGKHSFCGTTSVPIPCYRCKHFEPLVDAPHDEVLDALLLRQCAEKQIPKIGGQRNLLVPIDLSSDIRAVKSCIARCNARRAAREMNP